MGNDSDFFIFEIKCGYIPIIDSRNSLINFSSPVKCFKLPDFSRQFALNSDQQLFLPLILGNDFQEGCSFSSLGIDSKTAVHKIISTMKRYFYAVGDAGDHGGENAQSKMRSIQAYYSIKSQEFDTLSSCILGHFCSFPKSSQMDFRSL